MVRSEPGLEVDRGGNLPSRREDVTAYAAPFDFVPPVD
jgi:hypothetical protein